MVKTHLLFMICIVSGFLLTLQLISLQLLVRKGQIQEKSSWTLLDVVTLSANQHSIPLFLIDSEVLSNISAKSAKPILDSYCNVLCTGRKITHLATFSQFATQLLISRFIHSVKSKGFTVLELKELDPTLVHFGLEVSIPTHLIVIDEKLHIKKTSHVIHIAIFYERIQSTNWWYGMLSLTEHQQRLLHRQGIRKSFF
ncbi:unnamed protein product, partial [Medioppia subpectinata]